MRLHVIADAARAAAWNMAIDEALLEHDRAWLRFYTWDRPSISIGYFQDPTEFDDLAARYPIVRRMTGGGAILHASELTFALAVPGEALPAEITESYARINRAVAAAVGGIAPRSGSESVRSARAQRWCFARATALDLVQADGAKLFGSAQRRTRGRILHHGSLVIARHDETPFTGALLPDHGDWQAEAERLVPELTRTLATELGFEPAPVDAIPEDRWTRAEQLVHERYGDQSSAEEL